VDQIRDEAEDTDTLTPRRIVTAADPAKFNLDDLMLLIGQLADQNAFSAPGGRIGGPKDLHAASLDAQAYADQAIADATAGLTSPLQVAVLDLNEANLLAMSNTTPKSFGIAVGANQICVPVMWNGEKVITSPDNGSRAFAAGGAMQLVYASTDFVGFTLASDLNLDITVGGRSATNQAAASSRSFTNYTTHDPRGKSLAVCAATAISTPSCTGAMSVRVSVTYYLMTVQNPGVTP
jgi:hypothetical protein